MGLLVKPLVNSISIGFCAFLAVAPLFPSIIPDLCACLAISTGFAVVEKVWVMNHDRVPYKSFIAVKICESVS